MLRWCHWVTKRFLPNTLMFVLSTIVWLTDSCSKMKTVAILKHSSYQSGCFVGGERGGTRVVFSASLRHHLVLSTLSVPCRKWVSVLQRCTRLLTQESSPSKGSYSGRCWCSAPTEQGSSVACVCAHRTRAGRSVRTEWHLGGLICLDSHQWESWH